MYYEYYSPEGLSKQASSIKDFITTHSDYALIRNYIDRFPVLE